MHGGHCPDCLLGAELSEPSDVDEGSTDTDGEPPAAARTLTICLPLGSSARASVFLVRDDSSTGRLLRLKVWHAPAPDGFLQRFHELRERLEAWRGHPVALPLAASVDAAGWPAVLSEFRQGISLLDGVQPGTLDEKQLRAVVRSIMSAVDSAHSAGLAHGSVVAGNVLVQPALGTALLLDFGMTALLNPSEDQAALMRADRLGLATLARTIRRLPRPSTQSDPSL
jgi:aminoglycoside phosphotransferase (APT) family kinase protein